MKISTTKSANSISIKRHNAASISATPRSADFENTAQLALQKDLIQTEKEIGQLSLDAYETSTELILIAPIAGVKLENINLSITEDVLSISGSRQLDSKLDGQDYLIQECFWGDFSRSILLPDNVDTTKIMASFKDCVLKISLPRISGHHRTKLIKIKSA